MDALPVYNSRRRFLKQAGTLAAFSAMSGFPAATLAGEDQVKLTILHTNDVHSRIDPFPMDGSRYQGLGGIARRASLINRIRTEERHVLLLDAGDTVQGTPYFNLFGGRLEMELMNKLGYDASTFGNHEFDNGLEDLASMVSLARFPFLTSNYDFRNTPLAGKTRDYLILKRGGLRIGVFGLGIELDGLVDPTNCRDVQYLDPIGTANTWADRLRHDYGCHFVICLSHLGYSYPSGQVSDRILAAQTRNIDLIIGGHTHTFMPAPEQIRNLAARLTTVNQVGFAGIQLGRLDYVFDRRTGKTTLAAAGRYETSEQLA